MRSARWSTPQSTRIQSTVVTYAHPCTYTHLNLHEELTRDLKVNTFAPQYDFYPETNLTFRLPSGAAYEQPCAASDVQFTCPVSYLGALVPIPPEEQADFYVKPGLTCWKCPFPVFFSGACTVCVCVCACVL